MNHKVAATKYRCALCLRSCGFGMTRTMRALQMGKASVSRLYRRENIAINPERNGVALKGRGGITRGQKDRAQRINAAVRGMRSRVRKCLEKKAPRVLGPMAGMTRAEAFRWRYANDPEFRVYQLCRRRMKKASTARTVLRCGLVDVRWCSLPSPCSDQPSSLHVRPDQQRICFNWTNLRPLCSIKNIKKGARFVSATPCLLLA